MPLSRLGAVWPAAASGLVMYKELDTGVGTPFLIATMVNFLNRLLPALFLFSGKVKAAVPLGAWATSTPWAPL